MLVFKNIKNLYEQTKKDDFQKRKESGIQNFLISKNKLYAKKIYEQIVNSEKYSKNYLTNSIFYGIICM